MAETKDKNVQVRITPELLEKLKDERYRERKSHKPESSYAELLDRAWEVYEKAPTAEQANNGERTGPVPIDGSYPGQIKFPLGEPSESTSDAPDSRPGVSKGTQDALAEADRALRGTEAAVKRPPKRPGRGKTRSGGDE